MAAADFYFAINATFRFILQNYGEEALHRYWRALGAEYYAPLADRFRTGGLDEVARYWTAFFAAEPGGDVSVAREKDEVILTVRECPAIRWLRLHNREICPGYCQHCRHVSTAIAENAGMRFTLTGGGGTCEQTFSLRDGESPA
ncbi:MAG TPA: hypothetical protein PKI11_12845 [Candidatus Hydrogenedentes bacterium]|nr:hypothetical protein [Candidatus Hydrogenedentota bacterium]HNT87588.1 hypothetical protein [Candidatus Hydrogenedentota bacterium]